MVLAIDAVAAKAVAGKDCMGRSMVQSAFVKTDWVVWAVVVAAAGIQKAVGPVVSEENVDDAETDRTVAGGHSPFAKFPPGTAVANEIVYRPNSVSAPSPWHGAASCPLLTPMNGRYVPQSACQALLSLGVSFPVHHSDTTAGCRCCKGCPIGAAEGRVGFLDWPRHRGLRHPRQLKDD